VEDLEEEEVGGVSEEVPEVEGVEALGEEGVEVVLVAVGVEDSEVEDVLDFILLVFLCFCKNENQVWHGYIPLVLKYIPHPKTI
jgi:hypothetical protein